MAKKTESSGLLWLLGGAAALWLLNRYNNALESDPLAGTAAASLPASFQSDEAAAAMDVEADEVLDATPDGGAIPYDRPLPPVRDGGPTLWPDNDHRNPKPGLGPPQLVEEDTLPRPLNTFFE